jgi:hypothetical protein
MIRMVRIRKDILSGATPQQVRELTARLASAPLRELAVSLAEDPSLTISVITYEGGAQELEVLHTGPPYLTAETIDPDRFTRGPGAVPARTISVATQSARRYAAGMIRAIVRSGWVMNVETALEEAMNIEGALGAALVDWESGTPLGALGGSEHLDLDMAGAGNTEVVRAKMRTMASLGLDDTIEDILITLGRQYHLLRMLKNPGGTRNLFLYLALDGAKANLELTRRQLRRIESTLDF